MAAISTIRYLGPAMEAAFVKAGVHSAEALREMGADAAYKKLLENGGRPHFIGYYALHMALMGRPWNDCKGDEKAALRIRFDALKAEGVDDGRAQLESFLDSIGVIERRRPAP